MDRGGVTSKVDWKYPILSFSARSRRAVHGSNRLPNQLEKLRNIKIFIFWPLWPKMTKIAKNRQKWCLTKNSPGCSFLNNATQRLISSFLDASRSRVSGKWSERRRFQKISAAVYHLTKMAISSKKSQKVPTKLTPFKSVKMSRFQRFFEQISKSTYW